MNIFRKKGKGKTESEIGMAGAAVAPVGTDIGIDALVASLETTDTVAVAPAPAATESEITDAVLGAEITESYAGQPGDVTSTTVAPTPTESDEEKKARVDAAKAAKKADRDAKAATKKAEKDAAAAVKATEKAAKKAERDAAAASKPATVHYGKDKVGRLKATLGENLGGYMVLTMADATLTGDDLAAKQTETMDSIAKMGSKVQNRAVFLFDFVSGKKASLNAVLALCLTTLGKDGKIVTGDKGNFHAALLAKPYAPSAARAMGNNTVNLFRTLKLIVAGTEKQTFVANPESLLLAKANGLLGIGK